MAYCIHHRAYDIFSDWRNVRYPVEQVREDWLFPPIFIKISTGRIREAMLTSRIMAVAFLIFGKTRKNLEKGLPSIPTD